MIYLASPYSHPNAKVRERRFQEACCAAAKLLQAGVLVFSSIAHSHPIASFGMPTSWEFWSRLDREFLSRCEMLAVLTLPGWRESVGVQAEIDLALDMGLPIVHVAPTDLNAVDLEPLPPAVLRPIRLDAAQFAA